MIRYFMKFSLAIPMKIEKVGAATIKRALGCGRYALSNQGVGSQDKRL